METPPAADDDFGGAVYQSSSVPDNALSMDDGGEDEDGDVYDATRAAMSKTIATEVLDWPHACAYTFEMRLHRQKVPPNGCVAVGTETSTDAVKNACGQAGGDWGLVVVACLAKCYRSQHPDTVETVWSDFVQLLPAPVSFATMPLVNGRGTPVSSALANGISAALKTRPERPHPQSPPTDNIELEVLSLSNAAPVRSTELPSSALAIPFPHVATTSRSPPPLIPLPTIPENKKKDTPPATAAAVTVEEQKKKKKTKGGHRTVTLRFQTLSDGLIHLLKRDDSKWKETVAKETHCEKVTFSLLYVSRFPMTVTRSEAERALAAQAAVDSPGVRALFSAANRKAVKVVFYSIVSTALIFGGVLVFTHLRSGSE